MIAKLKLKNRTESGNMEPCPLGYTCELMCDQFIDDSGELKCENDEACEHFSLSWNLPYEYDEDRVLTVTNDPARFHWKKELTDEKLDPQCYYCPIKGMQAGFY